MDPGIYTLILHLASETDIAIGSLGIVRFRRGYYAYTGSARGPGGLARVKRHMDVMSGSNPARRWHIDYLLPHTSLVSISIAQTTLDLECEIAMKIGEKLDHIPNFGSTDCKCPSHLHYSSDLDLIQEVVKRAYESVGGKGPVKL